MLRLDLKDNAETVLFFDPMKGVSVHKYDDTIRTKPQYELYVNTNHDTTYTTYDSKADRDTVYEYVLTKINEYLFPQIEADTVIIPECAKLF